jgi:hypothetical protein
VLCDPISTLFSVSWTPMGGPRMPKVIARSPKGVEMGASRAHTRPIILPLACRWGLPQGLVGPLGVLFHSLESLCVSPHELDSIAGPGRSPHTDWDPLRVRGSTCANQIRLQVGVRRPTNRQVTCKVRGLPSTLKVNQ